MGRIEGAPLAGKGQIEGAAAAANDDEVCSCCSPFITLILYPFIEDVRYAPLFVHAFIFCFSTYRAKQAPKKLTLKGLAATAKKIALTHHWTTRPRSKLTHTYELHVRKT